LPSEQRPDLQARIAELRDLSADVATNAQAEMPEENVIRHALERLEAALRARTATGFGSS
ncbi:MAG TPA: hypothetical protein VGL79_04920, partial [Solirubrobacteraceae bacterium]